MTLKLLFTEIMPDQKMAEDPSSELAARMTVIGCQPGAAAVSRSVGTKAVRSIQRLKARKYY